MAAYEEADRAGVARPIVWDARRQKQVVKGALAELHAAAEQGAERAEGVSGLALVLQPSPDVRQWR